MSVSGRNEKIILNWGAPTPKERGPLILETANGFERNVIGSYGGPYSIFHAMGVAKGTIKPHFIAKHLERSTYLPLPRPLFESDIAAREGSGTFDPTTLIGIDPFGYRPHEYFSEYINRGAIIKPTISATPDEIRIRDIEKAFEAGTIKRDGVLIGDDGYVLCTKITTNPVWHLPSVANAFKIGEDELRCALYQATNNPELVERQDLSVYLPPYEGDSIYVLGDLKRLSNPQTILGMRIHDACKNSDIHATSRCTCLPYLDFAKAQGTMLARQGGMFALVYRNFEGRALGEVVKTLVYASRESGALPDTKDYYFQHTADVVGGEDVRPHELIAESAKLMGIKRVDLWFSMSDSKNSLLRCEGIDIRESVPLPPRLIPPRAGQEVVGKVMKGYNNGIYDYDAAGKECGYADDFGLRDMYANIPSLDKDRSQLINIRYCAVTGADDRTDLADLNRLAARFPFMEAALLWYPEKATGQEDRFPSLGWIHDFIEKYEGEHSALHLCGSTAFGEFISGDGATSELLSHFKRVQLNLKFENMRDKLSVEQINKIVAQVKSRPEIEFVIQYGTDDAALLAKFDGVANVAVFFDASAGKGELAHEYAPPLKGRLCGYAGGLNPDNVAEEIQKMQRVASGATVWVDAETGLRTNDKRRFDMPTVERFCSVVESFVPVGFLRVRTASPHSSQAAKAAYDL